MHPGPDHPIDYSLGRLLIGYYSLIKEITTSLLQAM